LFISLGGEISPFGRNDNNGGRNGNNGDCNTVSKGRGKERSPFIKGRRKKLLVLKGIKLEIIVNKCFNQGDMMDFVKSGKKIDMRNILLL